MSQDEFQRENKLRNQKTIFLELTLSEQVILIVTSAIKEFLSIDVFIGNSLFKVLFNYLDKMQNDVTEFAESMNKDMTKEVLLKNLETLTLNLDSANSSNKTRKTMHNIFKTISKQK